MSAWTDTAAFCGLQGRSRSKAAVSLGVAFGVHLLLIAMILTWRPPPAGLQARAIELALISQTGQLAVAPAIIRPQRPELATSKPEPATQIPAPASEAHADKGGDFTAKTPQIPPGSVATLVADLTLGGPDLSAQPKLLDSVPMPLAPPVLQSAGGKSCAILDVLQKNLRTPVVEVALSSIPRGSRSVSNAVLLWDHGWTSAAGASSASLVPLEQIVVQSVAQTPPACRSQIIHGPQFIILGDAAQSTVLAFGSGDWRWGDMVDTLSPSMLK